VDWKRASALLYGDWGTSKAYVIGLVFVAAGFSSLPIILAVCALTGLVGINYMAVCRYFPDGGGVYSAARTHGRTLAVIGALLLVADLTVTAALSGWEAMHYLGLVHDDRWLPFATIAVMVLLGALNSFGPRHSGGLAVMLAIPTVLVVAALIVISIPHLTLEHLEAPHSSISSAWVAFVGAILALSGVEAIANLTGVMKLDPGSTIEKPKVGKEAFKAILPVALEVTVGTALLGWAMLSMPNTPEMVQMMHDRHEDILRFMGEYYGTATVAPWFGEIFGWLIGIVVGLLLLSAVNTAIAALIGILYMMARDGEMPKPLLALNRYGVPKIPLYLSVALPAVVLIFTIPSPKDALHMLAGLYAIGVVGAIALNLGCCTFNKTLGIKWPDRTLFAITFVILAAVWLTLAKTKPDALFFVVMVLMIGLGLRSLAHKASGMESVMVHRDVADIVQPNLSELFRPIPCEGTRILVAAQGLTPVMSYALDEAELRKGPLYVLYVKKVAVLFAGGVGTTKKVKWEDDPRASAIMSVMLKQGMDRGVTVIPIFAVSDDPGAVILDFAATLGVDYLYMGGSQRQKLTTLLSGDVIRQVASTLPEEIKLIIYG